MRRVAGTTLLLLALWCAAGCGSGSKAAPVTSSIRIGQIISAVVAYEERGADPGMGRMFCRAGYMAGKRTGKRIRVYVWEACDQYKAHGRALVEGTAWSSPATITAVATARGYHIVGDYQPAALYFGFKREYPDPNVRAQIRILDSGGSTGSISPAAMFAADKRQAQHELLGG